MGKRRTLGRRKFCRDSVAAVAGGALLGACGTGEIGTRVPPGGDSAGDGDPTPGDPAPGDFAPGDFAPGDFAPGDFAPGDSTPGDFAPGDSAIGGDPSTAPGELELPRYAADGLIGRVYYVSTSGGAGAPASVGAGSIAAALSSAKNTPYAYSSLPMSSLQPGDLIVFADGDYTGQLRPRSRGSTEQPIVFAAEHPGQVTIHGPDSGTDGITVYMRTSDVRNVHCLGINFHGRYHPGPNDTGQTVYLAQPVEVGAINHGGFWIVGSTINHDQAPDDIVKVARCRDVRFLGCTVDGSNGLSETIVDPVTVFDSQWFYCTFTTGDTTIQNGFAVKGGSYDFVIKHCQLDMKVNDAVLYLGQHGRSNVNREAPYNSAYPDPYAGVTRARVENCLVRNTGAGKALGLAGASDSDVVDLYLDAPGNAIVIKTAHDGLWKDYAEPSSVDEIPAEHRGHVRYPSELYVAASRPETFYFDYSSRHVRFQNARWSARAGGISDSANDAGTADSNATNTFVNVGEGASPVTGAIGAATWDMGQIRQKLGL